MALKMRGFKSLLNRTKSHDSTAQYDLASAPPDSPEVNAPRAIRLFCESNSNQNGGGGEEVLHLPVIVEAAESSPAAAAASAQQIRRFLSKEWAQKPHAQYNAIMLTRILSDNPGHTFTRNFDKAFVSTVKDMLRNCKDQNTQQILRETLDNFEVNKGQDEGMQLLLQMWRKEKGQMASLSTSGSRRVPRQSQQLSEPNGAAGAWQQTGYQQPCQGNGYANGGAQQPYGGQRSGGRHQLPPPVELASRIEEARNTAKILMQLLQSTPAEERLSNELIKEFSERCQSAQKSMQTYINCDCPAPDDDTLQTLIETNEQLSLAGSRYQRAVLAARRSMGANVGGTPPLQNGNGAYLPPAGQVYAPVPVQGTSLFAPVQPPQDPYANGTSLFAQPQSQPQSPPNGRESYIPPPGPAPSMMNDFQHREAQQQQSDSPIPQSLLPRQGPVTVPWSDPFADPVEHTNNPAPLAIEPTNYGAPSNAPSRQPTGHRQAPSQTFSIDAEPSYMHSSQHQQPSYDRRNTLDLENSYSNAGSPPISARTPSDAGASHTPVSVVSPQMSNYSPEKQHARPGPGPWHNSSITPSYIGRQNSAAQGLTMHGAQSEEEVAEIDSHSDVGRRDRDPVPRVAEASPGTEGSSSLFAPSPVEVRQVQTARRVDVAGTGGFRSSMVGRS